MKTKITLTLLALMVLLKFKAQPCQSGLVHQFMQFNSAPNKALFKDKSVAPPNWQREYTHWDFGDGTQDTSKFIFHTFPQNTIYKVKKETKFSDIFNPSNYCVLKDSIMINVAFSSPTSSCIPSFSSINSQVQWLTGSTYGVSTIYGNGNSCYYNIKEIALIKGDTVTTGTDSLAKSVFATSHSFETVTIPADLSNYNIIFHLTNNNFLWTKHKTVYRDSIPATPTDCHASFFMTPIDSAAHHWTIQDFSSSTGTPSYFWDFGDGSTSTLATPSHTYATTGIYTVCLTISDGTCSSTYCKTPLLDTMQIGHGINTLNVQKTMLVTGISENKKQETRILLFPNPARNSIEIKYPFKNEDYTITISNLLGQQMLIQNENDIETGTVKLNIEDLNSGIYLLQINSKNGNTLSKTKFIKE